MPVLIPAKVVPPEIVGEDLSSVTEKHLTETDRLGSLRSHVRRGRRPGVANETVLATGIAELDMAFAQAARPGKIIEWGIPQGRNGRIIPLLFLRNNRQPAVWVYADRQLQIYAPAWASYGVDLQRLFFIQSSEPVKQLRPLFLDNSFKIIVLDSPEKISRGELAFISQQARQNKQLVLLIRNYFLSQNNGTALASVRVNCWQNRHGRHVANFIKAKQAKKIYLDLSGIAP